MGRLERWDPDVGVESTLAVASVVQATEVDTDMLFVRFEGQRIHIQQLLNPMANGTGNNRQFAVARYDRAPLGSMLVGWCPPRKKSPMQLALSTLFSP